MHSQVKQLQPLSVQEMQCKLRLLNAVWWVLSLAFVLDIQADRDCYDLQQVFVVVVAYTMWDNMRGDVGLKQEMR